MHEENVACRRFQYVAFRDARQWTIDLMLVVRYRTLPSRTNDRACEEDERAPLFLCYWRAARR